MILKLIPGQRIAFTVTATEEVLGNFGPQIKFTGTTPDDDNAAMFLNVEPANRQLERIGLTVGSVVGQTVEFERVEKNGTKYTNVNRLNGTPAPTVSKPAPARVAHSAGGPLPYEEGGSDGTPALPHEKLDRQFSLYDLCLDHAHAAAKKRFGNDVTDTAVASIAATLYIQAARGGV